MLAMLWRLLVALMDYRAWIRVLRRMPTVDVVFITNVRDDAERRRFFGKREPACGHIDGPRFYLNGVAGRIRGIYSTAEEMLSKEGRRLAQAQFIDACEWAERKGAKVVLLAASTKRLFGRDGALLKERFPNLLFTIGDNGTAQMLWADVERGLVAAKLERQLARLLVIGPYGILGSIITRQLVKSGYQVTGYGPNDAALTDIGRELSIPVTTRMDEISKTDAVIACTHSTAAKLGIASIAHLRRRQRKLLVIDVAEPANLDRRVYRLCKDDVIRQDAGNAYSPRLRYVLGGITWRMLMLSRGVMFGCFAEAMSLYYAIHRKGNTALSDVDWFEVSDKNMQRVKEAFALVEFVPPAPRCFGEAVSNFDLDHANCATVPTSKHAATPLASQAVGN